MDLKKVLKIIKEKVKIRTMLLLIVFLSFNAYAWFIYATKASVGVSAHVSSWNIEFKTGENQTVTNMEFDVGRIYPGMEKYTKELSIKNSGEINATISYKIKKIEILGDIYEVNETITSDNLLNMLRNDFPFKFDIIVLNGSVVEENGSSTITISLEWPFESGNDLVDTSWGERAYEYYSINPTSKSFHVELEIEATQAT